MTTLNEGFHTGEYLLSDGCEGTISVDNVTVTQSGAALPSGQVLGKITSSGKYVARNPAATDGSQHAAGILYNGLPAATGDVKAAAHVRLCEVNAAALTGLDSTATAELAALFIIVR
jgi:Bacteriophage lambda head decoration protein D